MNTASYVYIATYMASQHMTVKGLPIVAVHAYCYSYTVDQFKIDTQTWSV